MGNDKKNSVIATWRITLMLNGIAFLFNISSWVFLSEGFFHDLNFFLGIVSGIGSLISLYYYRKSIKREKTDR